MWLHALIYALSPMTCSEVAAKFRAASCCSETMGASPTPLMSAPLAEIRFTRPAAWSPYFNMSTFKEELESESLHILTGSDGALASLFAYVLPGGAGSVQQIASSYQAVRGCCTGPETYVKHLGSFMEQYMQITVYAPLNTSETDELHLILNFTQHV